MKEPRLLVGDIGGTNARFALANADGSGFSDELILACDDYPTAEQGIDEYLERSGSGRPDVICLAVAGPVVDGVVRFTNNHWVIDRNALETRFPTAAVQLLNDFEAIAYSLPLLAESDVAGIGPALPAADATREATFAVLGPGTGLGVAGLLKRGSGIHPVVGEGGHLGFAPESTMQLRVLEQLRGRFERVSNERLVSGPGLENIYWALGRIHGKPATDIEAAEIFSRVLARQDALAAEAVEMFFEVLGQVAGNLALTLGALDGVYLAGGIVKRYPDLLGSGAFRSGFENKGRHRALMQRVPTWLILHPQPGLLGAAYFARQLIKNFKRENTG